MHGKEPDDFSDRKFRKTLNITIINNFLDLENISSSTSVYRTLSAFFHHMRNSFKEIPHIFVTTFSQDDADVESSTTQKKNQKEEDYLSSAFTEWLMMWLLHVLSQPSASEVHDECEELFVSLLQLIKMHNSLTFRKYIQKMIALLLEMNTVVDRFVEGEIKYAKIKNHFHTTDKIFHQLQNSQELELIDIEISFINPEDCEFLKEKITSIIQILMNDITQILPDELNQLWHLLCLQIELGDFLLKKESISAMASLIKSSGFVFSVSNVNYAFSCLRAMITLCATFEEPITKEFETLEESVSSVLTIVIQHAVKKENTILVNAVTLSKLLQELLEVLFKNRFFHSSDKFKTSVVEGIISLLKYGYKNGCLLNLCQLQHFCDSLCQIVPRLKSVHVLLPIFVYLIKIQFNSGHPSIKRNKNENLERSESIEKMLTQSLLWSSLFETFQSTINGKQLQKAEDLRFLSSIAEILFSSFCGLVYTDDKCSAISLSSNTDSLKYQIFSHAVDSLNHQIKLVIINHLTVGFYEEVVKFYTIFISCQDFIYLSTEIYIQMLNVLSMPWILKENTLSDLQCEFIPLDVVKQIGFFDKCSIITKCLEAMFSMTSSISLNWKKQIFISCLSASAEVQLAAIQILPRFFYLSASRSDVLFEIHSWLLNINCINACQEVNRIFGQLCCVIANSCSLVRIHDSNGNLKMSFQILCSQCSQNKMSVNLSEQNSFLIPETLSSLLIHLISHSSEIVRLGILKTILSYFIHFGASEPVLKAVMHCIIDSDPTVRLKFSEVAGEILKPVIEKCNSIDDINELLIKCLQSALLSAKQGDNLQFQKTVIATIGEIGKVAKSGLLLITIISLLEMYMTSIPSIKVVAFAKLKQIGLAKQIKMQDLLKIYQDAITKFLAEFLFSHTPDDVNQPLLVLEEMRTIFCFIDLKTFIQKIQHSILPYLITKETSTSSVLITCLATVLHIEKQDFLINNFPFIFSHFVRHCSKVELEKALLFIQTETKLELGSLLRCNYQPVHNELLLHLSTHYHQVFSGLAILALKSENRKASSAMIIHTEDMANYLQPKLLGFLVFFDAQMLKSSWEDKKLALESLVSIMKLMGTRAVTAVRFKLMATLRLTLRFTEGDFPKICCKAWDTFVQSIEIPCLGSLLNQIIVALLPLLELQAVEVAKIFNYLIIEKRSYLSDFFHELYFVPETPELKNVNVVLKEYNENLSNMTDFCALLSHSLKGISHENLEVRLHALEKLKQLLSANQQSIYEHLQGKENFDSLISNLMAALISGSRESDIRIRTALSDCLGELGAIDPGRLNMSNPHSKETIAQFYNSIDDEGFAYALIQELVHSFLAAEQSGIQDCSACAIQEVLRYYKCSNEAGSSGSHLWQRFPPDIQEILSVLFHSQYKPQQKFQKKFPVPIYQSKYGNTFRDWTKNWFYSLLQKIKKENPLKLFQACSVTIKYDLNSTLFLLPHTVVYALLDSTEIEKNEICTEILTVLRQSEHSSSSKDFRHLSSQIVFSIFDHLCKWIQHYQQEMLAKSSGKSGAKSDDKNIAAINSCLSSIPQVILAKSSFACQAYARALMHLERQLKEFPDQLEEHISFLQKIYAAIGDPDSVGGVAAVRKEQAKLTDVILENEALGDMQTAFACYEKAIKLFPQEISNYQGLLKCFLGMDQPSTAISYANGLLNDRPEWLSDLNPFRIEAAWKLATWESLDLFLQEEENKNEWNIGIGNILHLANKKDVEGVEKCIQVIRSNQMAPLSAASMEKGGYLRGYEYLIRMHMLTDLQRCVQSLFNLKTSSSSKNVSLFDEILPTINLRRTLLQSSSRYQEPINNLHRILLKIGKEKIPDFSAKFDEEITNCWLQSARLARKNGYHQRAYSCLLEAGVIDSDKIFMEKTKWLWNKGEKEQAIYCLQKGISEHFPISQSNTASSDKKLICAKAKLLLAVYSEESSIVDSNSLINMYKEVVVLQPEWEASHFHLAKYYDKMLNTVESTDSKGGIMLKIVSFFGTSLKHGCKNVYHSLPRLLDIWFNLGTQQLEETTASVSRQMPTVLETVTPYLRKISNLIQELYESVPLFLFMTAFPQLISRICHSHSSVSGPLQKLISKLLASHSQQSMWMMIAVTKSSYQTRSKRCKQILQEAILLNPNLGKYIGDITRLADKLIELSNKNVGDANKLSISENFSSLLKLIDDRNFSQIMLPSQTQMIVTLPSGFTSNFQHNAFPFTPVYIRGFEDVVEVFPSLQKPKKIIVQGSDGKRYPIMCKPKDDLRKDCRLMEFNNLVNRYLKSDPEARRRQLYIRTYAVVPLNEECGLIEWVPNLQGLRLILTQIYKLKSLFVTGREIRAMMPSKLTTSEEKISIFKTKFLPRFPPVFHEWFHLVFSDPTAWYHARLAYARTTAVMSMVGYVVGLGDRHGENILFDSSCGDIVHVDLSCLFNKGETMEYPECVPFRLTHNMVDAMGPTGYEGTFRKACEVTMRVMRSKTDALMSVLRPFVHDPLVEWSKSKHLKTHDSGEITNKQGLTHVKDIELRLNGIIKSRNKQKGLPLSIEGQVNHLIQEAVDVRNLSQMYIGWAAYM